MNSLFWGYRASHYFFKGILGTQRRSGKRLKIISKPGFGWKSVSEPYTQLVPELAGSLGFWICHLTRFTALLVLHSRGANFTPWGPEFSHLTRFFSLDQILEWSLDKSGHTSKSSGMPVEMQIPGSTQTYWIEILVAGVRGLYLLQVSQMIPR